MSNTKNVQKCKQCGEIKSLTLFRAYYPPLQGHYKACLDCEKVNQRYKYLGRKGELNEAELTELNGIEKLYALQRQAGLHPPRRRASSGNNSEIMLVVKQQEERLKKLIAHEAELSDEVPEELQAWLTKSLEAEDPEDLQDQMDILWETYRPQIGLDENYAPKFDERFVDVLRQIQDRIDEYEGEFYNE